MVKGVCKVLRASSEDDPYLSLAAIFNQGYSQQQKQFVTGTGSSKRIKVKKRSPATRQSTTLSLVSFSGSSQSELEVLLRRVIRNYDMDLKAFQNSSFVDQESRKAIKDFKTSMKAQKDQTESTISSESVTEAAKAMVKIFATVHKLERFHAQLKEDPVLSDQDVLESMLKEIIRAQTTKLIGVLREGDSFGEQALKNKD